MTEKSSRPWWQTGIIYTIYTRSFKDSNGDGIGDIRGIIEKLDYLKNILGVDAVWVAGALESPMADFGYDISDYCNVNPHYGTLADYEELIIAAHKTGLKVIGDYVPNHCSDRHPWFIEACCSRENPKRDWFLWSDAKPDGSPPNNWVSVFGGSAWQWHEPTGQYYMHTFFKEQPELNWRSDGLKEAMFDVGRFWLERGMDGFRIDTAHHIMKDRFLRDNPKKAETGETGYKPLGEYDSFIHKYDREDPQLHDIYRQFRKLVDSYGADSPKYSIGEIHLFDWPELAKYYGQNCDELHHVMNLGFVCGKWNRETMRGVIDGFEAAIPACAWPNCMMGVFDETRPVTRFGQNQARVCAMLQLTMRGTPIIGYGEEIGMPDIEVAAEDMQDPWEKTMPGMGRDRSRGPMQWTPAKHAGFSSPDTPATWLPVGKNYQTINVETQLKDPKSFLSLYRKLISLRKKHPALHQGSYTPLNQVPKNCYVFTREEVRQRFLVALNFVPDQQTISLPGFRKGRIITSTYMDRKEQVDLERLNLRKTEGVLIEI